MLQRLYFRQADGLWIPISILSFLSHFIRELRTDFQAVQYDLLPPAGQNLQPQSCADHKVGYVGHDVKGDVHFIIINSSAYCGNDDHILRAPARVTKQLVKMLRLGSTVRALTDRRTLSSTLSSCSGKLHGRYKSYSRCGGMECSMKSRYIYFSK